MKFLLFSLPLAVFVSPLMAASFHVRTISYELDGVPFESTVTWQKGQRGPLPGVLMVPNWMGPTEASLKKAQKVAAMGYVVMMVDMYGTRIRPETSAEASAAAGKVRSDRPLMRARAQVALDQFRTVQDLPLRKNDVAAIGFCFGGGTVLELARAGAQLDAVISFHGDLLSPTLVYDASKVKARVLVLHGADDPYVPQDHVAEFIEAMQGTGVDWQLVQFSGTVHSFTDPQANTPGQAQYHQRSADRAFAYMKQLLKEIWD